MHTLATHTLFSGANNANYNDDPAFRPAGLKKKLHNMRFQSQTERYLLDKCSRLMI